MSTNAGFGCLFVVALLFGSLGLVAGWWFALPALSVVLPVLAVIGYVVAGVTSGHPSVSDQQFADSTYYLGFLMTLLALIVSLMAIKDTGNLDIAGLLARFAAALLTTVVGLSARMYLVNLSSSSHESLEDAERSLATSSQHYSRSLESLATVLIGQATRIQETSETLVSNLERGVAQATQAAAAQISQSAHEMAGSLTGVGETLSTALEKQTLAIESIAQSMRANQEALERTQEGLAGISTVVESMQAELAGAAQGMDSLTQLLSVLDKVHGYAETMEEAFDGTTRALEEITAHYTTVSASVGHSADTLREYVTTMAKAVRSSQEMMLQVSRELVDAAAFVRQEISKP